MKQDCEELRQKDLHDHGGLNIIPDIMVIFKNVNNDKEDNARRKGQLETTAQTNREGIREWVDMGGKERNQEKD